jgi:hypothetical protein
MFERRPTHGRRWRSFGIHDLRENVSGADFANVIAVAAPATRVILFSAYIDGDIDLLPGVDAVLHKRSFGLLADCIAALPGRATTDDGRGSRSPTSVEQP